MKSIQKCGFIVMFSIALVFVSLFAASTEVVLPLHFQVHNLHTEKTEDNYAFINKNGNCYVFLPSYASMDQVTVTIHGNRRCSLGDVVLHDGMSCGSFELETPYDVVVNNHRETTLWFYQSANVATMYIDTDSGTMGYIHEDKNYEEKAALTVYTADGELNHHDPSMILKGRGNNSWSYDKRPYALTLSAAGDLLDMGAATNWVLLSNSPDKTNLSNYLIYNLAADCGLPWTPECRYVDIYLNGEYNGLYLLTEKVEVGTNRLDLDTSAGDFLCKADLPGRCRNPIRTNVGRSVEISYPRTPDHAEYETIQSRINQMEEVILSGADLDTSELIDLDSWVRRYLLDEISANIDSDLASSYFYYSDGVFYAGPAWDYDMSFGNSPRNQEPCSFIAKNTKKSELFESPYYGALYSNESFYNRMVEIYKLEFLPALQRLLDGDLQKLINFIGDAAQMNEIRWESMYDSLLIWLPETIRETDDLMTYLDSRVAFLNDAWVNNTEYSTLQFEFAPDDTYWNISVPKGGLLETSYRDVMSKVWVDASTGEVYDLKQPVTGDLLLKLCVSPAEGEDIPNPIIESDSMPAQQVEEAPEAENEPVTAYFVVLLSVVILFVLFLGLVIIDVTRRRKERRLVDEHNRTEVSP